MGFVPTLDKDTGETFYGFEQDEAVFITNLMSYGSESPVFDILTSYIQMGHFFIPQNMIREHLSGSSFVVDLANTDGPDWNKYFIWHSSNTLYCLFNTKMYMSNYTGVKLQTLLSVYSDETLTKEQKQETIEILMGNSTPPEETTKRNVYFDNKKRMMYIDGKYYNTIFIKRSIEDA